ncbi:leukocyte surface antigen CD53-like isoform X2 [Takifugu rubripes]|uniref:leukocyte surface antigen CD53-like isoform X2 n=1 Tax=Takifugu rubripes TaxID=31033 RepID=UPI0011453455|nr:leukocyte surface antigen CD53-like isoform X2 [Takifugu rubripes]
MGIMEAEEHLYNIEDATIKLLVLLKTVFVIYRSCQVGRGYTASTVCCQLELYCRPYQSLDCWWIHYHQRRISTEEMNQSCISFLKTLLLSLNLLCWLCSAFVIAFGEFQMMHSKFPALSTTFWPIYPSNTLVVTGTIAACVCYIGVFGGMRENRCMLISFFILLFILMLVELAMACVFLVYSRKFRCCGVHGVEDWKNNTPLSCCVEDPCNSVHSKNWQEGCFGKLKNWFASNFQSTGAGVVTLFIIQFICMCINIPLFCYMGRRGLGYQ